MNAAHRQGVEGAELVINWGLGVDSTAYLVKMLEDPAAHGVDLARTMVLHELTGDEWPATRAHAEQYVLPLLREHRVRLVQVSRASRSLEIAVMDDSRQPERIIERGPWALWDEYETNGTVPQQGGIRLCSLHAKGEVGDALIAQELGDQPFRQVMGFNADEAGRSLRDEVASKNPLRQGVYPLIEWGWGREQCEAFLYERFGVRWEKSYCSFCCFPVSMGAMADHLDRMRAHPDIAGRVLHLEYTSVSLNPQARLFGRRSLLEQFDPSRAADRPVLAAFEEELACRGRCITYGASCRSQRQTPPDTGGQCARWSESTWAAPALWAGGCAPSPSGTATPSRSTNATGGCGRGCGAGRRSCRQWRS
jgi:hypothetical protein